MIFYGADGFFVKNAILSFLNLFLSNFGNNLCWNQMLRHVPGKPRFNSRAGPWNRSCLPPWKRCYLPGKAAGLIASMPLLPVRFEEESGQMLHPCVSSPEGPSLASTTGWMRNLLLQRWVPVGWGGVCNLVSLPYLASPFVGVMSTFPHPLCRWLLNLACPFQQPAFHEKQPGREMNGSVWSWMKYFAQPTDQKKRKKERKKSPTNWAEMD